MALIVQFISGGGQVKHPVIAAVVLGILVSGCQRKAEGQTVAVVNGKEITLPQLNFALDQTKAPENADKNAVRSQVLQQLVDRQLLVEQARSEGIDKSPEYLNRQRQADDQLLISMLAARRLNTAQLPSDRDVDAFITSHPGMFANRETWSLDQVQFPASSDAYVKAEIQKTKTMDQLIAVLQAHKITFTRQKNRLDTAIIPPELYTGLAKLAPGEPFVVPVGNRSVASVVTGKEPNPLTGDQAKPAAVAMMRKQQTAKSIADLLKSLRSSAKVEYQPGYAPPTKKS
jgi:EpsD family peptidyl-prolyl cis-trans isomerase